MIRCCHGSREREVKLWVLGNGLRGKIHCRGRSPRRDRRWGRRERGGSGGDESCGTFFTADKNICWDINLEPWSSLPLLPHHPSSFRANHHLGTPSPAPPHFILHHPRTSTHPYLLFSSHTHGREHMSTFCDPLQSHKICTNTPDAMPISNRTRKRDPRLCGKEMQSRAITPHRPWSGLGRRGWAVATAAVSPSLLPLAPVGETPPSGCPLIGTFACTPSLISQPSSITHRDQ